MVTYTGLIEWGEFAKILGMSKRQFRFMTESAKLPYELINKKRHFDFDVVMEALNKEALKNLKRG